MTDERESLFHHVRLYRGVVAKWPIPHGAEREVTEVWVALCEAVEAADAYAAAVLLGDDLDEYETLLDKLAVLGLGAKALVEQEAQCAGSDDSANAETGSAPTIANSSNADSPQAGTPSRSLSTSAAPSAANCVCGHPHVNPDGSGSCSSFLCRCETFVLPGPPADQRKQRPQPDGGRFF